MALAPAAPAKPHLTSRLALLILKRQLPRSSAAVTSAPRFNAHHNRHSLGPTTTTTTTPSPPAVVMLFTKLFAVAFAAVASAQSLTDALASQNSSLSLLNKLLAAQPDLVKTLTGLSGITILAPSDAALSKLLTSPQAASITPDQIVAILTYHVINGTYPASAFKTTPAFAPTYLTNSSYTNVTGGQVVEGYLNKTTVTIVSGLLTTSLVTTADIRFAGGIIHVIDTVLTIPFPASVTAQAGGFSQLVSALNATNLIPTLDGLKDVTIFAPTNDAFAKISSTISTLTTAQIASILTYHVVVGKVGYSSLLTNTTLKTVNGGSVNITVVGGNVFVNAAKVIVPDVLIAGGVAHAIDSVLSPPTSGSNTTVTAGSPTATATGGAGGGGSGGSASGTASGAASGASSTAKPSTAGAPQDFQSGVMGLGALFGGAALLLGNL